MQLEIKGQSHTDIMEDVKSICEVCTVFGQILVIVQLHWAQIQLNIHLASEMELFIILVTLENFEHWNLILLVLKLHSVISSNG